jgi:hypothetical protein
MRRAVNALALPVAAGVLLAAATARPARAADDTAEAEALIREGIQLRVKGDAPRALPLFEKAYQLSRSPRTAAQLGLVELEVGAAAEAERYLTEALATPDHPWIAKNRATLKRQLEVAKRDIGELVVTGSPAGAEVSVNHKPAGRLPLAAPIRLDKGRVDIEVRAPGFEAVTDTVLIAAGKQVRRAYMLARSLAPEPVAARAPARPEPGPAVQTLPADTAAPGTPPSEMLTASPAPAQSWYTRRPVFWVTAGAALAALALGTVEAFDAAAKRNTFNDHTSDVGGVPYQDCGTASLSAACQPLKDAYDRALTLSVVGFAAAGVLASGASAMLLLSRQSRTGASDSGGSAHALGCLPDPITRGLTCNLRF